jgi:hydroxymethylpyrimidine/phosphomethylpyrimidine kinase
VSAAPAVLIIAGSDSSGGAGLSRDIQVLTHFSVRPLCAVTAVTAQSDARLMAIHPVPPQIIRAQIAAAFETCPVAAIKIGMLGTGAAVEAVAGSLAPTPTRGEAPQAVPSVILDPVLVSSSGGLLLTKNGQHALKEWLLPRVTLLTPNIPEAAALLGEPVAEGPQALIEQAKRLTALGPQAVLLKGGHGSGGEAVDYLWDGASVHELVAPRLPATQRGTGCTLASAVAACLARGFPLLTACREAKKHVQRRLERVAGKPRDGD